MKLLLILFILAVLVFLTLLYLRPGRVFLLKTLLLPGASILFVLCLIAFSNTAVSAALKGLNLWFNIVFPSLFPFFVASELLNRSGFVRAVGILLEPVMRPLFNIPGCGSFAFAMGITSGYPVGAKITADLREENLLKKEEAERLLAFSNNSGPLFIIGSVSVGMFKLPEAGLFMLACHILACITVGVVLGLYSRRKGNINPDAGRKDLWKRLKKALLHHRSTKDFSFGVILGEAVRNSVTLILAIGGFIILFSVIINLLLETGIIGFLSQLFSFPLSFLGIHKDIVTSALCGIFEITTGTNMLSSASRAPLIQQLTGASLVIGWAGLSVHAQVASITSRTDMSIKTYLLGKTLQGIFSAAYTFIGIKTAGSVLFKTKPAFLPLQAPVNSNWYGYLWGSCGYLLGALIFITALAMIALCIRLIHGMLGK
ncbi:MAG: sporulation integral membrane protein YlbJ [Clostridiales bacterium]|jgi:sporulation integral membrane protein YlbJ|nr:sporulation integral membrane protein YlbJ [Eubacteriales bacterium]MDH7565265.1 sporulation integral membrane protein YlbJ [Clostridiales bacterium]